HEPEASTQGEPGDPGARDGAAGGGQAVCLALEIEIRVVASGVRIGYSSLGIDTYRAKARQVDQHPVVAERVSGDVVASAANRNQEIVLAREANRLHHVAGAQRLDDDTRPPVDHAVEDAASPVIRRIARPKDAAVDVGRQGAERLLTRHRCHATLPITSVVVDV